MREEHLCNGIHDPVFITSHKQEINQSFKSPDPQDPRLLAAGSGLFSITGLLFIAGHSLSAAIVREMIDSGQDSSQSSNTKSMKCLNGMR